MITQSPRTEFIGGHVTPAAKKELQRVCAGDKKSMSLILSELVDEFLEKRRHPMTTDLSMIDPSRL